MVMVWVNGYGMGKWLWYDMVCICKVRLVYDVSAHRTIVFMF